MKNNRQMQALDDEVLDRVIGGLNLFDTLLGKGVTGYPGGEIPLPVPTAQKDLCRHEYLPGSNFCRFCGKPRQ